MLARLNTARWAQVVAEAHIRAEIFDAVVAHQSQTEQAWRKSLAAVSPSTRWSSFMNWKRRFGQRSGPPWERLLDEGRPTPPKPAIADEIIRAALNLRRGDRSMTTDTARGHLWPCSGRRARSATLSVLDNSRVSLPIGEPTHVPSIGRG